MFTPTPARMTLLYAKQVPPAGGDTLFANLCLAYDTLSDGMKAMIADLHTINQYDKKKKRPAAMRSTEPGEEAELAEHPLVRRHPETGRSALYISNSTITRRIAGMTEEESRPLIDYLVRHATKPEFVYRHQWRKDDILVWDNRCTMHQALGDFDESQLRHMERTTVLGTPSGYVVAA